MNNAQLKQGDVRTPDAFHAALRRSQRGNVSALAAQVASMGADAAD